MKVFFTTSTKQITKYEKEHKVIIDTVKKLGHKMTREWVLKKIKLTKAQLKERPVSQMYSDIISAILAADLVIIEGTVHSTSIGYQLTYALEKKKSVLFLSQLPKENLKNSLIGSENIPFLTLKSYKKTNLSKIVTDYLARNDGNKNVRLNLVIDKEQDNYLEWASFNYKQSKTRIIKKSINKTIKGDSQYKRYLEG